MSPQVLWPPQDPQARYPTKAYCIQLWICYLWGAQRTCQNPSTPSRQVPHHINSTQDFVEQVKHITLASRECLSSDDVSALFTSVPIDPALKIIKDLLVKDPTLKDRKVIGIDDIILLLEFCLKNTYFSFQGQFFEQVEGAAMGSPVSPIVANLYMEYLEQKALSTAPHPPGSGAGMWMTPSITEACELLRKLTSSKCEWTWNNTYHNKKKRRTRLEVL